MFRDTGGDGKYMVIVVHISEKEDIVDSGWQ